MKTISLHKSIVVLLFVCLFTVPCAAGDWHEEFNELCSKVEDVDSLSAEELQALKERADKLLPQIQESDEPKKKVYVFRLKKCRAMFDYSLQLKK